MKPTGFLEMQGSFRPISPVFPSPSQKNFQVKDAAERPAAKTDQLLWLIPKGSSNLPQSSLPKRGPYPL
jgi:hypothetical protein